MTQTAVEHAVGVLTDRAVRIRRRYDINNDFTSGRYEGYLQALSLLTERPLREVRMAVEALAEEEVKT